MTWALNGVLVCIQNWLVLIMAEVKHLAFYAMRLIIINLKFKNMVQTTEFRIGNWIQDTIELEERYFQIEQLRLRVGSEIWAVYSCGRGTIYSKEPEPIPLSRDILLKCGFEDCDGHFTHPENEYFDLIFSVSENGLCCAYNMALVRPDPSKNQRVEYNPICNPFKYLHQLQNLYLCLTGKELNFIP